MTPTKPNLKLTFIHTGQRIRISHSVRNAEVYDCREASLNGCIAHEGVPSSKYKHVFRFLCLRRLPGHPNLHCRGLQCNPWMCETEDKFFVIMILLGEQEAISYRTGVGNTFANRHMWRIDGKV